MNRLLCTAAASAAAFALAQGAAAQNCYDNPSDQCFSFGPKPDEASRLDTGINLRSKNLTITGDIRFRMRGDDNKGGYPYADGDQMTSRVRVQLAYQLAEYAKAFVEFNFAETWNGSESYSDALAKGSTANPDADGVNYNGISQAYVEVDDMFGVGEKWRIGRSTYILSNGLILGSCDYLQNPDTFTGAWLSRAFGKFVGELFVLDDDGPLQAPRPGTRFWGGTGKFNVCEDGLLGSVGAFYMAGTSDGDNTNGTYSNDSWYGLEARGTLPWQLVWNCEGAQRQVANGADVEAYSVRVKREFEGWFHSVSLTRTDSSGAMHVNPADFNSAGLLHQYAGAWRSNLDTTQLGFGLRPGCEFNVDVNLLALDRDGSAVQQGEFEVDIIVGKQLKQGIHGSLAYGIDDEDRQVAFAQLTMFF